MVIIGIDPGPQSSGVVVFDSGKGRVETSNASLDNAEIKDIMKQYPSGQCVVEDVAVYSSSTACKSCGAKVYGGARASKALIEMAVWIGRWMETAHRHGLGYYRIPRPVVVRHFDESGKTSSSSKAVARAALRDRFGGGKAKGSKKMPGPLYGVSEHAWEALAASIAWAEITGVDYPRQPVQ